MPPAIAARDLHGRVHDHCGGITAGEGQLLAISQAVQLAVGAVDDRLAHLTIPPVMSVYAFLGDAACSAGR